MLWHRPTAMTKLFLDILDDAHRNVFSRLAGITSAATLGGGTALALQINHRKSFDFDVFVPNPILKGLYHTIEKLFGESPVKRVDSQDQLTVQLANAIELTVLYYWYPPLYTTIATTSIPLFDIKDIATDKAVAIGKRNVWRDYVDFFYLLHDKHITLNQIIQDGEKRFGNEFSSKLFMQQLTYTKDVTDFTYTPIGPMHEKKDIMSFLTREVKQFLKTNLS